MNSGVPEPTAIDRQPAIEATASRHEYTQQMPLAKAVALCSVLSGAEQSAATATNCKAEGNAHPAHSEELFCPVAEWPAPDHQS